MKNKNRYAESTRKYITTDASGKYVVMAEIDTYSGCIVSYEVKVKEAIQKKQREIAARWKIPACRIPQRKELEEVVSNAFARINKSL